MDAKIQIKSDSVHNLSGFFSASTIFVSQGLTKLSVTRWVSKVIWRSTAIRNFRVADGDISGRRVGDGGCEETFDPVFRKIEGLQAAQPRNDTFASPPPYVHTLTDNKVIQQYILKRNRLRPPRHRWTITRLLIKKLVPPMPSGSSDFRKCRLYRKLGSVAKRSWIWMDSQRGY